MVLERLRPLAIVGRGAGGHERGGRLSGVMGRIERFLYRRPRPVKGRVRRDRGLYKTV